MPSVIVTSTLYWTAMSLESIPSFAFPENVFVEASNVRGVLLQLSGNALQATPTLGSIQQAENVKTSESASK
jgi:hypothetical protein